jgi:hypothetical protein
MLSQLQIFMQDFEVFMAVKVSGCGFQGCDVI